VDAGSAGHNTPITTRKRPAPGSIRRASNLCAPQTPRPARRRPDAHPVAHRPAVAFRPDIPVRPVIASKNVLPAGRSLPCLGASFTAVLLHAGFRAMRCWNRPATSRRTRADWRLLHFGFPHPARPRTRPPDMGHPGRNTTRISRRAAAVVGCHRHRAGIACCHQGGVCVHVRSGTKQSGQVRRFRTAAVSSAVNDAGNGGPGNVVAILFDLQTLSGAEAGKAYVSRTVITADEQLRHAGSAARGAQSGSRSSRRRGRRRGQSVS
jgi:hypothetical protein